MPALPCSSSSQRGGVFITRCAIPACLFGVHVEWSRCGWCCARAIYSRRGPEEGQPYIVSGHLASCPRASLLNQNFQQEGFAAACAHRKCCADSWRIFVRARYPGCAVPLCPGLRDRGDERRHAPFYQTACSDTFSAAAGGHFAGDPSGAHLIKQKEKENIKTLKGILPPVEHIMLVRTCDTSSLLPMTRLFLRNLPAQAGFLPGGFGGEVIHQMQNNALKLLLTTTVEIAHCADQLNDKQEIP